MDNKEVALLRFPGFVKGELGVLVKKISVERVSALLSHVVFLRSVWDE